jgi:hypothetical protein
MNRPIFFILILLIFSSAACVSVKIGAANKGAKRAEGVQYQEPSKPFSKNENTDVDASWQNSKNGNVISFLSDCKDPSDPPLDNIVAGVVAGVSDLKIESREVVEVQGREGRRVLASGSVDGVPSAIDLLVFKRNYCIFILTYAGVKSSFAENREEFTKFLQGFKSP